MKKMRLIGLLALGISMMSVKTYAQAPGSLDLTFGGTGYFTTAISAYNNGGRSVAIQPDGKIVAAGYANNGSNDDFAVVRYNTNGTLDQSFGTNGMVTSDIGNTGDYALAVLVLGNGKILIGGYSAFGLNEDFAMARYNSNGTLDATFGVNGFVTDAIGNAKDEIWALGVQNDGKIMAGGVTYSGNNPSYALARYSDQGVLDLSYAVSGFAVLSMGGTTNMSCTILVQPDNKTIISGYTGGFGSLMFGLARYDATGVLDNTFGTGGKTKVAASALTYNYAFTSALNPDGSFVVAGTANSGGSASSFVMAKFTKTGALDNTFGTGGKVMTSFGNGYAAAQAIAIQPDGKIILAGYVTTTNAEDFAVVRYNANGSIDGTFGTSGKVVTAFGSKSDYGFSVAVQSDGKIVVAGISNDGTNNNLAMVRYNGNIGTGFHEYAHSEDMQIYPNPVADRMFFVSKTKMSLEVINTNGQSMMIQQMAEGQNAIDVSGLPAGMYFIKAQSEQELITKRFIKM